MLLIDLNDKGKLNSFNKQFFVTQMDESFYQDGPEEIKIVELIDDFPLRRDGVKNPAQKAA